MKASFPATAFLSRRALRSNVRLLRASCRVPVMAVLKADAYGHGAALVAPQLYRLGLRAFGVTTLAEGAALRAMGLSGEILVLGYVEEHHFRQAARLRLGVTAWSLSYLRAACRVPGLRIHLKVDSGMIRLGFKPSEVPAALRIFPKPASAYTHLACAGERRDHATAGQLREFLSLPWPAGTRLHAANSAAALRYPDAHLDLVRSGILLYGCLDSQLHPLARRQEPVLSFKAKVLRVREIEAGQGVSYGHTFRARRRTRVATISAGYADGVPRLLSNRGELLLRRRRCRIIGRICMDHTLADATALPRLCPGEEAVLLGKQGGEEVTAQEWAELAGTNSYEILCGIGARVPRVLAD